MSNRYLAYFLAMAGGAGVLYGLGTNGVMSIAKPYIEASTGFDAVHLSLLVGGCLLGSVCVNFVAGTLSDWFGRKKMFLAGAILFAFGSQVVGCVSRDFVAMYCGILMQGLGMGIVAVVMPMYIAETLPKEIRGRGTGFFQLVMIGGILASGLIGLALSICVGPADSPTMGVAEKEWCWHVIYRIVGGLAAGVFVAGLFLEESPVWLKRRDNRRVARSAKIEGETRCCDTGSIFQRRYMVPFAIAFTILACNQATGINAILGYSTTIFRASGLTLHAINVADVILKMAMFSMTAVACLLVDRKGRVFLLELGTRGMIVSMLAAGALMMTIDCGAIAASPATGWCMLAALVLFISSFCIGPGICVWLALTELMPSRIRGLGIGVALMANQGIATGLQSAFLPMVAKIGYGWMFVSFAVFGVIYYLTVHLHMPETKGRTLEDIEREWI